MKVAVVGGGTMGNGIAQVFAQHGHSVVLRDLSTEILDRARSNIGHSLARLVEKGKLAAVDKDATLGRIQTTTELDAVASVDFVVEAVLEDIEIKSALFRELDRVARPDALLTSNTSSISITRLGAC
ncbi:MAG TPA: 3-hydroxyacyl-CoA dehydrogenase NAD-binding domain-containing protein, partial [Polyangia bacterium]|nr:3-hydroxyacyl-CoA dehydrogenase NAD-binding domain-containing protein [Polyangia bacterium]